MQEINGEKYMTNSLGHLVPLDRVDEVDKLRDETVMELVGRARALSGSLKNEKSRMRPSFLFPARNTARRSGAKKGT